MNASVDDAAIFARQGLQIAQPVARHVAQPRLSTRFGWLAQYAANAGLGLLLPGLLLALWSVTCQRHWVAEQILPPPAAVVDALYEVVQSDELLTHVRITLFRLASGLLIGGSVGLVLGFGMALSERVKAYVLPSFQWLAQLPVLGWIPLLIIFVGIEEPLKVSVVSIAACVPMSLGSMNAIRNIPRNLVEVGRVFQFSVWQLIRRVVLPAAAPGLFTALRQSVTQAWLAVIFVELLSSSEGLGFLMAYSRSLAQIDLVIVAMLVIGVLGLLIEGALQLLEQGLLGWRRSVF